MTRITDAYLNAIARGASPRLEHSHEEDDFVERGPLTVPAELTDEAAFAQFEVDRTPGKAQDWHRRNDSAAVEAQLVDFRARGIL